jgi:hypothetical protein
MMISAMRSRVGEASASLMPAKMLPPMRCCGGASRRRGTRSVSTAAMARNVAETGRRFIGPMRVERNAVMAGPAIAPAVPPTAMMPYQRRASCSS